MKNEVVVKIGLFKFIIKINEGFAVCVDPADRRIRYKKLEIPENVEYDGKNYIVKETNFSSFDGCKAEEIVLPSTLETIKYSFTCCRNLKKIIIPKSVKIIGDGSFCSCPRLDDVYFEGNPDDIIIQVSAFANSGWINKKLEKLNDEFYSPSVEEQVIYLGKNLVGVWREIKELRIKPGTRNVYLYNCSALEKIFFPSSINTLEINTITNLKEVHYETMESFLGLNQMSDFRQRENFDLYIAGRKITNLEIPLGTKILRRYLTHKTTVNNIDIPHGLNFIYDFAVSEDIDEVYFPKDVGYVASRNLGHKVILWSSLARRILTAYCSVRELTILVEPLLGNKRYCCGYGIVFPQECITISIIFTFDPCPSEVTKFFKDIWPQLISHYNKWSNLYLSPEALLCEDFIKSSVLSSVKPRGKYIYVPPYLVEEFKNHAVWSQFTVMPGEYSSSLKYEVLDDSTACVVCNPDNEGNNTYSGLFRIPDYIEVDGSLHKISEISDFAFSSISDRLRVIVPWDIKISDLAFFDSPKVEIIDYVEDITNIGDGSDSNE